MTANWSQPWSNRCPYCVLIDDFMLMSATLDGRFVCMKCGHVTIPGDNISECPCLHCEAMRAFLPAWSQWWSVPKES
jgi:hypothetical protein